MYNFEYIKSKGLQVRINEDELGDLMRDEERENKRLEDLDFIEECKNDRTEEQQKYHDTGMRPEDYL